MSLLKARRTSTNSNSPFLKTQTSKIKRLTPLFKTEFNSPSQRESQPSNSKYEFNSPLQSSTENNPYPHNQE